MTMGELDDQGLHTWRVGDRAYYTHIEPNPVLRITEADPWNRMVRAVRETSPTGAGVGVDRFHVHVDGLRPL